MARGRQPQLRSQRARRHEQLKPQIYRVWEQNFRVYGARKVWKQMNREGMRVARCTVERLMRGLGIEGVRRGKWVCTTVPDSATACPQGLARRHFEADRPNRFWVADFTYVSTWHGWAICGLYYRRLCKTDCRLASLQQHDDGLRLGCSGTSCLRPSPNAVRWPYPSFGSRVAIRVHSLFRAPE